MNANEESSIKYLLVIHCDDNQGHVVIRSYSTEEDRAEGTKLELYAHEMDDRDKDMWAKQLSHLREDLRLEFEGDPPIQWLNAIQISTQ